MDQKDWEILVSFVGLALAIWKTNNDHVTQMAELKTKVNIMFTWFSRKFGVTDIESK